MTRSINAPAFEAPTSRESGRGRRRRHCHLVPTPISTIYRPDGPEGGHSQSGPCRCKVDCGEWQQAVCTAATRAAVQVLEAWGAAPGPTRPLLSGWLILYPRGGGLREGDFGKVQVTPPPPLKRGCQLFWVGGRVAELGRPPKLFMG